MSSFRPWAFWRRVQYGAGFFSFWALVGTVVFLVYSSTPPTCFDLIQNGDETGVDCGGSCTRICTATVKQPTVEWAESFIVQDGQYNAVAYIQNTNSFAGTPELKYTFTLYDSGAVIAERTGTTELPPNSEFPIFEGRILTDGGRIPTDTKLTLEPVDVWLPAETVRNQFRVQDFSLDSIDSRPRLTAMIENTELTTAEGVEVVATIFDSAYRPITTSQTIVDSFAPRTTREVVFTWPRSIAPTIKSCDVPSDIMLVLDRSGSMAADGGEPPEPLESAKKSAQDFVLQTQSSAQVGFLSYATTPSSPLEQPLTSDKQAVSAAIAAVTMGTDGVQYTNMGDAFASARAELVSERHRDDARKVIIFLTDGDVTRPVNPETNEIDREYAAAHARTEASRAKEDSITIYTIGFGEMLQADEGLARDVNLIRDLASGPDLYFEAPTIADLERVYKEIATGLCEEGPTRIEIVTKNLTTFKPLR